MARCVPAFPCEWDPDAVGVCTFEQLAAAPERVCHCDRVYVGSSECVSGCLGSLQLSQWQTVSPQAVWSRGHSGPLSVRLYVITGPCVCGWLGSWH